MFSPQLSQEVEPLVDFNGQSRCVLGPGQVVGTVPLPGTWVSRQSPQQCVYVERSMGGQLPPDINSDLLCFADILVQIVEVTPDVSPPPCTPAPLCPH